MIEVRHLTKRYGDTLAVDDLNFTIEKGRIYGFLGPNGAGKSTTMNIITGYLASTDGSVTINGHDILEDAEAAKKNIGYLPELPPLYFDMTVKEYLAFAAELKKIPKAERKNQISRVSATTKLDAVQNRLIKNLSKGYRQRVGLAQALLGSPEILILDEPTAGLDPKGRDEILDQVAKLHKERGITVILVSHSMEDVAKYVDRIIVMNQGSVMFDDIPKSVFAHYKELEAVGLAAPQVTYLMHELAAAGIPVSMDATTVAEAKEEILAKLGR